MTLEFKNAYIKSGITLVGRNEHNIQIKGDINTDYYDNEKSVEMAEASYQIKTIKGLLKKEKLNESDIDVLVGGDLQSQLFASSFASRKFNISHLGIYSACATFTESLIIASNLLENEKVKNIIVTTSAHNLASEKQFRFPIEYGALRKKVNTFTATGSVSALITSTPTSVKLVSGTIGSVVDLGYTDANNFGACMAPSAAKTIKEHLISVNKPIDYYDLILTGDLGVYGVNILKDYLKKEYKIEGGNIMDAGSLLFDKNDLTEIAGGSGPVCLPLILFGRILKENYKKILLVGTGSLHSKTSCNLGESIPSISHAVSLEVIK